VIAMFGAIAILFALPWIDTSKVRSMRYRPTAQIFFCLFVIACLILGVCGANPPDAQVWPGVDGFNLLDSNINSFTWLARVGTVAYFSYLILVMPILGLIEKPLPMPESISTPVLTEKKG
jgi:ubiquinol-cytochrome c reductase cytochrome b subunit